MMPIYHKESFPAPKVHSIKLGLLFDIITACKREIKQLNLPPKDLMKDRSYKPLEKVETITKYHFHCQKNNTITLNDNY